MFSSSNNRSNRGSFHSGGSNEIGYHVQNSTAVKEYGFFDDKNGKFRVEMEDTSCHRENFGGDRSCGLYAVFDGHGGRHVADHCSETFPREFAKEL